MIGAKWKNSEIGKRKKNQILINIIILRSIDWLEEHFESKGVCEVLREEKTKKNPRRRKQCKIRLLYFLGNNQSLEK